MSIQQLTEVQGSDYPNLTAIRGLPVIHFAVTCRDCGDLPAVTIPSTAEQAGMLQRRHLAEHLKVLAEEMAEAAR